jgi:hypothetical protein
LSRFRELPVIARIFHLFEVFLDKHNSGINPIGEPTEIALLGKGVPI